MAITWSILISTAYENICDGPYVNSVANEYQLELINMRYIVRFLGEAIANDGKYFFFGGGTEKNETALQTLEREIIEETGYTLL